MLDQRRGPTIIDAIPVQPEPERAGTPISG